MEGKEAKKEEIDSNMDDFVCGLCEELLSNPVYTGCCGANFCKKCIESPINDRSCPECEATNVSYVQDRRLQKRMRETMVACKNRAKGCIWSGSILQHADHLDEDGEDGCPFVLVSCPKNCGAVIERGDLRDHLKAKCNVTWVECEYCNVLVPSTGIENHLSRACPEYSYPCPNGCSEVVKRVDMVQHRSSCPLELVRCPFEEVGCDVKSLKRSQLQEHLESRQVMHSVSAVTSVRRDIKALQDQLRIANEERERQSKEIDGLQKVYTAAKTELEVVKEKNMVLSSSIAQELVYVSEQPHNSKVKTLSLSCLKDQLNYLTNPMLHKLVPNGPPITFRMPNFSHLKRAETTFQSMPFVVHNGYQMAVVIHPNGHGDGQSTHLSICLHLVSGHYDDELQWPLHFEDEVYATLMKQDTGEPVKGRGRKGSDLNPGPFIVQERIRVLVHLLHKINKPIGEHGLAFGYIDLFCAQSTIETGPAICNDSLVFQLNIKPSRTGATRM
uniref:Uncharacterized protein n=2 Tax=Amphimedon queenslandica TaxID=400682 RepID=A0A1X7V5G0_AMPQE